MKRIESLQFVALSKELADPCHPTTTHTWVAYTWWWPNQTNHNPTVTRTAEHAETSSKATPAPLHAKKHTIRGTKTFEGQENNFYFFWFQKQTILHYPQPTATNLLMHQVSTSRSMLVLPHFFRDVVMWKIMNNLSTDGRVKTFEKLCEGKWQRPSEKVVTVPISNERLKNPFPDPTAVSSLLRSHSRSHAHVSVKYVGKTKIRVEPSLSSRERLNKALRAHLTKWKHLKNFATGHDNGQVRK